MTECEHQGHRRDRAHPDVCNRASEEAWRNPFRDETAFQQVFCQFLDKERDAVGTLDDAIEDFDGQRFAPSTLSINVELSRRPNRLNLNEVTCDSPVQGGSNSGRQVTIINTGNRRTRSVTRSSSSSEVESIQCASSKTNSTGR